MDKEIILKNLMRKQFIKLDDQALDRVIEVIEEIQYEREQAGKEELNWVGPK